MTDSPAWTTRLRQLGPNILTILQNNGRKHLLHIRVFSRPSQTVENKPSQPVKKQAKLISPQSSRLIHQAASYIADDSLREALLKLANHTTKKNPDDRK